MAASTMQKPNANQVICEKCGKWTDYDQDKCTFCGAPLFGDELANDTKTNEKDINDDQKKMMKKQPS